LAFLAGGWLPEAPILDRLTRPPPDSEAAGALAAAMPMSPLSAPAGGQPQTSMTLPRPTKATGRRTATCHSVQCQQRASVLPLALFKLVG
jgi:hypothetical protein